jgi:TPP-dependent trihydroxycyclohexane-1,2-dione (THcHDO) dehydratase
MRKNAAFDALNEFFGGVMKRRIDPHTYYSLGCRLMTLQRAETPFIVGYGGVGESYSGASVATALHHVQPQHSLPLPQYHRLREASGH